MKENKSSRSVRNICIAAIKRKSARKDYKFTKFYEHENIEDIGFINLSDFQFTQDELPIVSLYQYRKKYCFFKEKENWWVMTTHKIFGKIENQIKVIPFDSIEEVDWGDFKGIRKKEITKIKITLKNNTIETFFIETGEASMIPIYAFMNV